MVSFVHSGGRSEMNRPTIDGARGLVTLMRRPDGSVVCERCMVAYRMWPRMRGLLGKRGLDSGAGLLIRPAPSIHTFFMRFPIDVVFLSRQGEVLKVAERVPPWRARSCRRSYAVLELAAGEAGRRGIAVGDRLDAAQPAQT
jgi:uncharacterized membrane protein (UPF0127 family)